MNQKLKVLINENNDIITKIQNENKIDFNLLEIFINNLSNIVEELKENKSFLELNEEFNEYLKELIEAIEKNDIILLINIYNYKVKDIIEECQ